MFLRLTALVPLLALCGCQSVVLRNKTNDQAQTVTGLYYQEVVDNLALHASNPSALPYFSYASTGQNAVQRTASSNYTLNWDLITSAGALFNRYLFDKQSSQLAASQTNNEQWTTTTTSDPDKIQLMLFAYEKAFGTIIPEHDEQLCKILKPGGEAAAALMVPGDQARPPITPRSYGNVPGFNGHYCEKVYPGWFCTGSKRDVPKNACFVGTSCDTYVWVTAEHMADLANFTLAILDIATLQQAGRQTPVGSSGTTILATP